MPRANGSLIMYKMRKWEHIYTNRQNDILLNWSIFGLIVYIWVLSGSLGNIAILPQAHRRFLTKSDFWLLLLTPSNYGSDWLIGVDCVVLWQKNMGTEFINESRCEMWVLPFKKNLPGIKCDSGTLTQTACHTDNCTVLYPFSIRRRAILPSRNIQKHNTTYVVQPLWRTSTVKTIPKVNFGKEATRNIVFGSGRSKAIIRNHFS